MRALACLPTVLSWRAYLLSWRARMRNCAAAPVLPRSFINARKYLNYLSHTSCATSSLPVNMPSLRALARRSSLPVNMPLRAKRVACVVLLVAGLYWLIQVWWFKAFCNFLWSSLWGFLYAAYVAAAILPTVLVHSMQLSHKGNTFAGLVHRVAIVLSLLTWVGMIKGWLGPWAYTAVLGVLVALFCNCIYFADNQIPLFITSRIAPKMNAACELTRQYLQTFVLSTETWLSTSSFQCLTKSTSLTLGVLTDVGRRLHEVEFTIFGKNVYTCVVVVAVSMGYALALVYILLTWSIASMVIFGVPLLMIISIGAVFLEGQIPGANPRFHASTRLAQINSVYFHVKLSLQYHVFGLVLLNALNIFGACALSIAPLTNRLKNMLVTHLALPCEEDAGTERKANVAPREDWRPHCETCYDDCQENEGEYCEHGHFTCGTCLEAHAEYSNPSEEPDPVTLRQTHRPDGKLYCPMHQAQACTAPAFDHKQLAKHLSSRTLERAVQIQLKVCERKALIENDAKWEKVLAKHKTNCRTEEERIAVQDMMKRRYPNARQCPKCGVGPVINENCDNLQTHHAQGGINNSCRGCGWFSKEWNDWVPWNGKLSPGDAKVAARPRRPLTDDLRAMINEGLLTEVQAREMMPREEEAEEEDANDENAGPLHFRESLLLLLFSCILLSVANIFLHLLMKVFYNLLKSLFSQLMLLGCAACAVCALCALYSNLKRRNNRKRRVD